MHVANDSLYITIALLLWSFRIVQRPDAPINTLAFRNEMTSHAMPFEVDFVPRMDVTKLREMMMDGSMG